ncbi:MAG TPA: DUF2283 domain-containing protein [Candidatus Nanoarchaeia archaeon]|nr:DUF2283 domain-containing protein [Candidatus Nanoarchaeia archaeon]
MKIMFDKEHDIMRITFSEEKYDVSEEMGDIIIDRSKNKKIIAIEILNVSKKTTIQDLKEVTVGLVS